MIDVTDVTLGTTNNKIEYCYQYYYCQLQHVLAADLPMTRSLAEASIRELVSATPYKVTRDEEVLRLL